MAPIATDIREGGLRYGAGNGRRVEGENEKGQAEVMRLVLFYFDRFSNPHPFRVSYRPDICLKTREDAGKEVVRLA